MKIRIMHRGYGCDSGCCGHILETEDEQQIGDAFDFCPTPREDIVRWAKRVLEDEFGADHCHDLDFENSYISENCPNQ